MMDNLPSKDNKVSNLFFIIPCMFVWGAIFVMMAASKQSRKNEKLYSDDLYYQNIMQIVKEMETKTAKKTEMTEEEYWKRVHENRKKISPNYVPVEHDTKRVPTKPRDRYYNEKYSANTEEYWHLEKEVTPIKEKKYGTIIKN